MASLVGKKIVIVGGSSGIGLGVATAALARGAELVIVGRSAGQAAGPRARRLAPDGRVKTIAADMTQEAEVARLFAIGAFDHLVSTAGTPRPAIRSPTPTSTSAPLHRQQADRRHHARQACRSHAARRRLDDLHLGHQQGQAAGPRRRRGVRDRRLLRLFRPCPGARAGPDARQRGFARLGRYADVGRTRRRRQSRLLRRAWPPGCRQADCHARGYRPAYIYLMESDSRPAKPSTSTAANA